jgi:hypothetical protein
MPAQESQIAIFKIIGNRVVYANMSADCCITDLPLALTIFEFRI